MQVYGYETLDLAWILFNSYYKTLKFELWLRTLHVIPQIHANLRLKACPPCVCLTLTSFPTLTWDLEQINMRADSVAEAGVAQSAQWLGYKLNDRGSIPGMGQGFFSFCYNIQACSENHPVFYPTGIWGSFPRSEVAGAWSWPLTSI
jgi:hypothetical protein